MGRALTKDEIHKASHSRERWIAVRQDGEGLNKHTNKIFGYILSEDRPLHRFAVPRLVATRSHRGSKSHLGFYSRPSRRFATQRGKVAQPIFILVVTDEV